jgi:hypothetical protein
MLLFGLKTEAAFDLWSLEHLANGIAMAAVAESLVRKFIQKYVKGADALDDKSALRQTFTFLLVLVFALFWENAEHYVEAGLLPGTLGAAITHWFQGVEHWTNRLIADNLMIMLGWFIYNRHSKRERIFWAAKVFSTLWLAVHIFVFPHSMYLQELLVP